MRVRRMRSLAAIICSALVLATATTAAAFQTSVKPYAVPIGPAYETVPLLSVGDRVPRTSDTGTDYQMVGIPDGLGATSIDADTTAVFMNHEFSTKTSAGVPIVSEPVIGAPKIRGAFVSRYEIDDVGEVLTGDLAFTRTFQDNRPVGPIATDANDAPAFGRFCSAFMADGEVGFTEPIYLTNEESDAVFNGVGGQTFSPLGGQTVAIVNGRAHALSRLGHFAKENSIVQPGTGAKTVIYSLEDGPTTPDSQLYMYVGTKVAGGSVLDRNGLINGKLYVFAADAPTIDEESDFQSGSVRGHWVEIRNARKLDDIQLETAADAAGALGFIRLEDGAFSPSSDDDFFFVTTGEGVAGTNRLGRVYHLRLGAAPLSPARLDVVLNTDLVFDPDRDGVYDTSGAVDAPLSPDNIDASAGSLMVQEDGTSPTRAVMSALGRDGAIWRFDLDRSGGRTVIDAGSRVRVAELDPPRCVGDPTAGRDPRPVGDERHHRHLRVVGPRLLAVRRAGARPVDPAAGDGDRRGRSAPAPASGIRLIGRSDRGRWPRATAPGPPQVRRPRVDAATAALYHFDEGAGNVIHDAAGPADGVRKVGGDPRGPRWSAASPF